MGSRSNHHALVFGASGITGWAIVNAILNDYPSKDAFARVTALTNRPLSLETAQWPASDKLQHVAGIDMLQMDEDGLVNALQQRVPSVETVTTVYFFAYIMHPEPDQEIQINIALLKRAVVAVERLSPKLNFVVLPTGTKAYGVHLIDQFPWTDSLPLRETLPRIPEPFASQMFYYNQLDLLKELSKGKQWTFCDVIPDVIVGFVPNNNVYCLAQWLALYLSLCREMYGEGADVIFPGTMDSWAIKSNDSSQDIVARFSIYASLHPEVSAGQSFNTADNAEPSSWSIKWPIICEYFGLRGVMPAEGSGPDPAAFLSQNQQRWFEMERKYGLASGRVGNDNATSFVGFPYFIMSMFNFDRHLDLSKMHQAWGNSTEERDTKGAWYTAFDRFRKAKIIPRDFR